jgi:hypothetical protein
MTFIIGSSHRQEKQKFIPGEVIDKEGKVTGWWAGRGCYKQKLLEQQLIETSKKFEKATSSLKIDEFILDCVIYR